MFHSSQSAIAALAFIVGCHATNTTTNGSHACSVEVDRTQLTAALLRGDEERLRVLTDEIFAGKRSVSQTELVDERTVAPNVLLRTTYQNRDYQLGVNTVSEYALCVLEIKNHTSTENILRVVAPGIQEQCSNEKRCEICNAQAFPVSTGVKQRLIQYWSANAK